MTDETDQIVRSANSAADAAARWMVLQMMHPTFNNADTPTAYIAAIRKKQQDGPHPSAEELAEFGRLLTLAIDRRLRNISLVTIRVDHNPYDDFRVDRTLVECADQSGLDLNSQYAWPWRTIIRISNDAVYASAGGVQMKKIWSWNAAFYE